MPLVNPVLSMEDEEGDGSNPKDYFSFDFSINDQN